jgi:hypothetical protein
MFENHRERFKLSLVILFERRRDMFGFLAKLFRTKKEIEAKMFPAAGVTYGGKGEVEIDLWSDGEAKVEAELKYTSIPDGSQVEVVCAGQTILMMATTNGFAKFEQRFQVGQDLPEIKIGDQCEFHINGSLAYQGQFKRD